MRDFLKQIKADYLLSSILCILLGVIFVIFKGGVIDMIGTQRSKESVPEKQWKLRTRSMKNGI